MTCWDVVPGISVERTDSSEEADPSVFTSTDRARTCHTNVGKYLANNAA